MKDRIQELLNNTQALKTKLFVESENEGKENVKKAYELSLEITSLLENELKNLK